MAMSRKRWISVALVATLAAAGAWCYAAFFGDTGVSRLVVDPPELDVQSDTGNSQQVEFTLTNSGSGRIVIEEIRTNCGCTMAVPLESNVLEAGAQTVLRVRVQPPGFGKRETAITILTNSQATPMLSVPLRLQGQILTPPFMRDSPQEIRHSAVDGGHLEIPFVVLCLEHKDEPPWLVGFEGDSPQITVSEPAVLDTNVLDDTEVYRRYECVLKLAAPDVDAPPLTDMLRPLTRTAPVRPSRSIPVTVSRQPVLRAVPSALLVSSRQLRDAPWHRRVALFSEMDEPWEIVDVEPSAAWVEAKVLPATEEAQVIEVRVAATPPDGDPDEATVRIKTTHPRCPETTLSVVLDRG